MAAATANFDDSIFDGFRQGRTSRDFWLPRILALAASVIGPLPLRGDYTKVHFTYARGEPLANAGAWHHAARSDEGMRSGRSWPGLGRLSTFQR